MTAGDTPGSTAHCISRLIIKHIVIFFCILLGQKSGYKLRASYKNSFIINIMYLLQLCHHIAESCSRVIAIFRIGIFQVFDNCPNLAPFTPVATFGNFGQNQQSAGILLGCERQSFHVRSNHIRINNSTKISLNVSYVVIILSL